MSSIHKSSGVRRSWLLPVLLAVCAVSIQFGATKAMAAPDAINFTRGPNEQIRVVPGTKVSLHWKEKTPPSGRYFLVTSDIPDFGNSAKTKWPAGASASWNATWGWWSTDSHDIQVSIPSTATAGQDYKLQVFTCDGTGCSNSGNTSAPCGVALPSGKFPCTQATLTATGTNWSTSSYSSAYSTSNSQSQNIGSALDVTTDSSGVSWNSSEFSNTLGRTTHDGTYSTQYSLPRYVQPGNTIKLSWGTQGNPGYRWNPLSGSGTYYLITSPTPTALPNFGSGTGTNITWPSGSDAAWNSTWGWYKTTSESMTVKVPSGASYGTTYGFNVYACNATKCSNSSAVTSGPYGGLLNLSVAAAPSNIATDRVNNPFTTCFNGTPCSAPYTRCFTTEQPNGCSGVPWSAGAERVTTDSSGKIWMSLTGWMFDPDYSTGPPVLPQPNDSELVSFDPSTQTFCTYQVPGVDPEVVGMDAQGDRIFFVETYVDGHPSFSWGDPYVPDPGESRLAYFKPSEIGNGCPSGKSTYYPAGTGTGLAPCPVVRPNTTPSTPSNCNMIQLGPWGSELPSHVMSDPATFDGTGGTLWATNMWSEVDKFEITDLSTGEFTFSRVNLPSHPDATAGSLYKFQFPWQLSQDSSYVYSVNYGDNYVDRIDKSTMALTQEAVPVQSDGEQLHSTAVSNGKLYFTLSDDSQEPLFGAASSFGTISLGSSWGGSSAPTSAKIYSGLDALYGGSLPTSVSPKAHANFRGISVRGNGTVTMANQYGVVSVAP